VSVRQWLAREWSTVAGSCVVDGGKFMAGLRRGDGERERGGGKDLGGKWVLGTKNWYRKDALLFFKIIYLLLFFFFFF
jgi:hypothetical protein